MPKARLFHFDLYGKREDKYNFLDQNSMDTIAWKPLPTTAPHFFFVPKNFHGEEIYQQGFKINELFGLNSTGISTEFDHFVIQSSIINCQKQKQNLKTQTIETLTDIYGIRSNSISKLTCAIKDIRESISVEVQPISYRPFDSKFCLYTGKANGLMARPRSPFMQNLLKDNFAITLMRRTRGHNIGSCFIAKNLIDKCILSPLDNANVFPLYLYPESGGVQDMFAETERQPNLNPDIVQRIAQGLGLRFVAEKPFDFAQGATEQSTFAPIDLLDYIYAVLHSPKYRETYQEFLKIDFPRVPFPTDAADFWRLVALGGNLRQLHLLESAKCEDYITSFPNEGTNCIEKIRYEDGNVWINATQCFENVPETAWNFYIGGYQPAQKWLKDRKDRELSFDDLLHYQKMIVALTETANLQYEIDNCSLLTAH